MKRLMLLCLILLGGQVLAAGKQAIYQCSGPDGGLIFQQTVCADSQVTGNSPAHRLWRELRQMVPKGKRVLTNLGADIPSIRACKKNMEQFHRELEAMKTSLAKLPPEHRFLVKAYGYLNDCGVCRTSAVSACNLADDYLDKAMVKLTEH